MCSNSELGVVVCDTHAFLSLSLSLSLRPFTSLPLSPLFSFSLGASHITLGKVSERHEKEGITCNITDAIARSKCKDTNVRV